MVYCIQFAWTNTLKFYSLKRMMAVSLASLTIANSCSSINPTLATELKNVADISTSGFIFKDTLKVSKFADPKLPGITVYLSDFDRPINEKLSGNIFDDPSSTSLTCVQTAPVSLPTDISYDREGEEVFEESKNLFFKQIRVRRVVDKETNTLIYVSYNTRLNKGDDTNKSRYKSSLCAIHI